MDKSPSYMLWEDDGVNFYTKYVDNQIEKTLPKYIQEAFSKYPFPLLFSNPHKVW